VAGIAGVSTAQPSAPPASAAAAAPTRFAAGSRGHAWIITIGDELLRGEIVDSNKSFFSERLLRLDLESARHVSVGDEAAAIEEVVREASSRAQLVLISGGLGPTSDDITTEVIARCFGRPLQRHAPTLERMRSYFASVGRQMSENNAKQADFPEGAEILPNPLGTAPGFMLELPPSASSRGPADSASSSGPADSASSRGPQPSASSSGPQPSASSSGPQPSASSSGPQGCLLFCTPGVPQELYRMVDCEILPRIAARLPRTGVVRAGLLRTFGLGESTLDLELADLSRAHPQVELGFRTQFPDNLVRVVVRGQSAPDAEQQLAAVLEEIRRRLGPLVLGEGETRLESIVAELMLEHKATVAVAESCTGGLLAHLLTDTPGSSGFFRSGVVAYSNESKLEDLGVDAEVLRAHGAVSEPVARQMAEGIRARARADYGLATTGVAGPDGGSEEKPVGTLYVALASAQGCSVQRYQLLRDRSRNKTLAVQIGLEWLRRTLLGLPLPDETFPRMRRARS
jgi:nicotinamide-nucleotide amidase